MSAVQPHPGRYLITAGAALWGLAFLLLFAPNNLVLPGFISLLGTVLILAGIAQRVLAALERIGPR